MGEVVGAAIVSLVAIPLVALHNGGEQSISRTAEVGLALSSGLGFSLFFILIGQTNPSSGQWPMVATAASAALVTGLLCLLQRTTFQRPPRLAVLAGLGGVIANVCVVRALQIGPISVVTVLNGLYPVVTSTLAARFDRQPISKLNAIGIAAAVCGAGMVAAFG